MEGLSNQLVYKRLSLQGGGGGGTMVIELIKTTTGLRINCCNSLQLAISLSVSYKRLPGLYVTLASDIRLSRCFQVVIICVGLFVLILKSTLKVINNFETKPEIKLIYIYLSILLSR